MLLTYCQHRRMFPSITAEISGITVDQTVEHMIVNR